MALPLSDLQMPEPQRIVVDDGIRIATYSWGDPDAPVVVAVHGFASNTHDNWVLAGWMRRLSSAGFRVLGIDQRGHGQSDKPHDPAAYSLRALAADVETVLDTYLIDTASYLGYSLGGRVGWQVALDIPDRIDRAVLGGVPDGTPLERLSLDQAQAHLDHGAPVEDPVTRSYIALTERVPGNDLQALLALARGMRSSRIDPDPDNAPPQPLLFATGSEDAILEGSRRLADATSNGRLVVIPGRHHFNAPASRDFREAAVAFLTDSD
ncbi:alpha/beta fold hydrolase [Microbacterium sp.]|uniref:alpha/beta fold hydrolase n=1 Tax=Microbacterium sp. TaxID=51671 RepID=UPI0033412CF1